MTIAAVMTDKGTGAISTVVLCGGQAEEILKKIFKPQNGKPDFRKGKILLGHIFDGTEPIDQVTIGCEDDESFAIHCHGNPLIVTDIMRLLEKNGAAPVTSEQLLCRIAAKKGKNAIEIEAQPACAKAKTLTGNKIIANQISMGLAKTAGDWLNNIDWLSIEQIQADAQKILENSQTAKLIIAGCKAIIAGPANSGKSTLLNCLTGREKAIVSDIKGTTRDWIAGSFQTDVLWVELIDTAGLGECEDSIDNASQEKTRQLLKTADIILLVLDSNDSASQIKQTLSDSLCNKKIITVLNKSDLPARLDIFGLGLSDPIKISAKTGDGLEGLKTRIRQICGCLDFNLQTVVCFTGRQEKLLQELTAIKSKKQAVWLITELLNGEVCV